MMGSRRRRTALYALAATGLAALSGCPWDAVPIEVTIAENQCIDAIMARDAVGLGAEVTTCMKTALERVGVAAEQVETANACLIVERVGSDRVKASEIARVPMVYRPGADGGGGTVTLVEPKQPPLEILADKPINAGLFLFAGEADCGVVEMATASTSCALVPGCQLRLFETGLDVGKDATLDFRGGGTCGVDQGGDGSPEMCNGEDEDCDGRVDESVDGGPLSEPCESPHPQVGICVGMGVRTCEGGVFGACEGYPEPQLPMCVDVPADRVDFDCDGDSDEALSRCGTCDPADCPCEQTGDEICDGFDNDCDGETDEDFDLTSPFHCGGCGNDCALDLTAGPRDNTDFVCNGGICEVDACTAPYVDFNLDPSDGCECRRSATEIPFDGIDQTCDGVDFVGDAIYVSAAQGVDGGGAGGSDRPYRTLPAAIEAAAARGGAVTVVLERGDYPIDALLDVPGGVSIAGGYHYEPGGTPAWLHDAPEPADTTITGPARVLRYPLLDVETALVDVRVEAAADAPTGNSIAITVDGAALAYLTLARVEVQAGEGGPGVGGDVDPSLPPEPQRGQEGKAAASGVCPGCGGNGGEAVDCGGGLFSAAGGRGGDGALPDERSATDGTVGLLPDDWPGGPAAPGGAGGGDMGQPPIRGTAGLRGPHGAHSASGSAGGRHVTGEDGYWLPAMSAAGARGVPGAGGGGGGGAGLDVNGMSSGGGGGGGGGSGGCPGEGGGGALGGYGSFGLVVAGQSRVRLVASTIGAGAGGDGGAGARGQRGSPGGDAGAGGDDGACAACDPGEDGGLGGHGGCGGSSGGAAGGPSFAILRIGPDPDPEQPRVEVVAPAGPGAPGVTLTAAAPGAGGAAADHTDETWQNACRDALAPDAGVEGAAGEIGCCPVDGPCVDGEGQPFGCAP